MNPTEKLQAWRRTVKWIDYASLSVSEALRNCPGEMFVAINGMSGRMWDLLVDLRKVLEEVEEENRKAVK